MYIYIYIYIYIKAERKQILFQAVSCSSVPSYLGSNSAFF